MKPQFFCENGKYVYYSLHGNDSIWTIFDYVWIPGQSCTNAEKMPNTVLCMCRGNENQLCFLHNFKPFFLGVKSILGTFRKQTNPKYNSQGFVSLFLPPIG